MLRQSYYSLLLPTPYLLLLHHTLLPTPYYSLLPPTTPYSLLTLTTLLPTPYSLLLSTTPYSSLLLSTPYLLLQATQCRLPSLKLATSADGNVWLGRRDPSGVRWRTGDVPRLPMRFRSSAQCLAKRGAFVRCSLPFS